MLDISRDNIRERVLKTFPERQFIHRTGGQVNYFILSTRAQIIMAMAGSFLALWFLFTFFTVLWGQSPLRSSSKELMVQKAEYERYLVDLEAQEKDARTLLVEQQEQFELAAKHFEDKHNTIVAMITKGGIVPTAEELNPTKYASSEILMSPMVDDIIPREARVKFGQQINMATGTVIDASLVNLELDQNKILHQGERKIQDKIEKSRAVLRSTGLSLEAILKNGTGGMGGPLIEISGKKSAINAVNTSVFLPRLDSIKARATESEALEAALKSVPLAHPIDAENYLTSPYGQRKDPFTKRPTMHSGMDMASYRLAPIVATADAKVKFSGRRSGYGRVVELDHGHGFITRYAHLAKTYVKRGQIVEKGEKIAGMGSSGRSTSTHLHYEIIFENRTYNPKKFMKAGQYVQ
ncbi:MAG: M23 family metallopeptidase [Robiginitomaculum sp.]|nr:M23 family metallopeptidase [Robiginitomaculum sp.]